MGAALRLSVVRLGCSVIEQEECDLIVGWYFEPYGFVQASLARPYADHMFLRHAGKRTSGD